MIFVYMDNILITTPDDKELHKKIANKVLDTLAHEDFYLKLAKCHFHQKAIEYLGICIEGGTIKIDPTKCDGLADWAETLKNVYKV
jgi:hypothetical protein